MCFLFHVVCSLTYVDANAVFLYFPGLPLVVAFLPHQRIHSSLPVHLFSALLLLKAANNRNGQHDPLLWIHHDHGPHVLPLHR